MLGSPEASDSGFPRRFPAASTSAGTEDRQTETGPPEGPGWVGNECRAVLRGRPFRLPGAGMPGDMGGMASTLPDFVFEERLLAQGAHRVAGVDEAGRGPLAGPVVAAAVILAPDAIPEGLDDSKRLSAARRAALHARLMSCAEVGVGIASVEEIDRLNILRAAHLAMIRALSALGPVDHALIDGNMIPQGIACPAEAVVKGDARCLSIAAASIVAKCVRDGIMVDLAQQHPGYGWEKNAGYATAAHQSALRDLGITPHHRRSFAPVHNILYQEKSVTS